MPKMAAIKKWSKKLFRLGIIGLVLAIVAGVSFFLAIRYGALGELPTKEELKNIKNHEASTVYSADGVLLGRYFTENRTNVKYDEISPAMIEALIAIEDVRFYEHAGIDGRGMARVFFKSILLQNEKSGGGSTLSQQLTKNLYKRQSYRFLSTPVNKVREMIVAHWLEEIYTKKEILTLYLNTVSFGEDVYGIDMAAKRFFNTSASHLKPEQAAVLAGALKSPTSYNPRLHPEKSQIRRNTVLAKMSENGYLTSDLTDSLMQLPLTLDYQFVSHSDGIAPYFREHLRKELEAKCKTLGLKADGTPYSIYTDGLVIKTTINSKWQKYAEDAVNDHLKNLQKEFFAHWKGRTLWKKTDKTIQQSIKLTRRYRILKEKGASEEAITKNFDTKTKMRVFKGGKMQEVTISPLDSIVYYHSLLNAGFMASEPHTGYVRAWVGGIDHQHLKYDHVKAKRQAGSVFKPIVYASALQEGILPCEYFPNEKITYNTNDNWTPENAGGGYGGYYSLKGALAKSVNTVAAQLIDRVGTNNIIKLAKEMGIKSDLPNVPSLALGVADVSLIDLMEVYGTIANRGKYVSLTYLLKIEDKNGKVLYDVSQNPTETHTALTQIDADMLRIMMQGVVDSGTARSLRHRFGIMSPIAGKTGTTQNQTDGRFMGFTPNLVAGAWVGGSDRKVRFRTIKQGQGAYTALPIWAKFYKSLVKDSDYKKYQNLNFPSIDTMSRLMMECENYRASMDTLYNRRTVITRFFENTFDNGDEKVLEERVRIFQPRNENERQERKEERKRKKEERKKNLNEWLQRQKSKFEKEEQ